MNRKNLKLLADYLYNLPEDYNHFDMERYVDDTYMHEEYEPRDLLQKSKTDIPCGTVACAAGHLVFVKGIPKPIKGESWENYTGRIFSMSDVEDLSWFTWCFSGNWTLTDNTAKGAAQRIYWLLKHGVPENSYRQRNGIEPLCYKEMTP